MFEAPRKLIRTDNATDFDCGKQSLNKWLRKFAWQNQQGGTSVTYIVHTEQKILAYYSLATGSVAPSDAPERASKGVGKFPIPIMLLARLAVDKSLHGQGVGYSLLQDALTRTAYVADQVGLRALVVDALDEEAKNFYLKYGFEPCAIDDMRLILLMKDIRKTLGL